MLDANALAAPHGTTSRLLIHVCAVENRGHWTLSALVRRVLDRVLGVSSEQLALSTLEIRDLPGHRLLTLSNASVLIDVVLPAGTYHVTAQTGESRRSYTVVLQQDATTDLYLQPHLAARTHSTATTHL